LSVPQCSDHRNRVSSASDTIHALGTPDLSGSPLLLPNGKVVLLRETTAEVLDLATGAAAVATGLMTARTDFSATLLPDGRVLVIGGIDENGATLASVEYWPGSN
jgi:Galactose oxidase, central domain